MKLLPSLFKTSRDTKSPSLSSSWPWPSCKQQPKTFSFRADDNIFKTVNSVFIDAGDVVTTPESSWFTNSSESASFSTVSEVVSGGGSVETMIRGLRSERLFFEPGDSNSILEEAKAGGFPFKESLVLAMESKDPYVDFRTSMEEMVEAHGLKDWECLEELLCWYLRVNGKKTHGFIVGAFVDLLVGLAETDDGSSSSSSSSRPSYPSSSSLKIGEIEEEDKDPPPSISEI
ncbi:transcription repressor OFP13-like [Macadamia integrifolia]|uniref:transcription repressor OFP13-like n=1 Tax=Macadamia integrifolia TaxID=60698 RepID=UPI001C4E96FA|nr:transcription repressor OFP13-like [Macadamia integrifolia]